MTGNTWDDIRAILETQGRMTHDGITRTVTARVCRCGNKILAALDGDIVARDAHVDPNPVNALGEALAVLGGQGTWRLRHRGQRFELQPRDQWSIAAHPADTPGYVVVVEHRCDAGQLPAAEHQPMPASAVRHPVDPPF